MKEAVGVPPQNVKEAGYYFVYPSEGEKDPQVVGVYVVPEGVCKYYAHKNWYQVSNDFAVRYVGPLPKAPEKA